MEMLSGDLYVRKATLEYLASAHYDERLQVGIRCERIGNSSMRFIGCVFRGQTPLVTSELVYVFADPATQTSKPVPPTLRSVLEAFEAREPMTTMSLGSWDQMAVTARALRHAVFVQELGIPAEIEADAADAQALHAVATNRFGMAVGTGRAVWTPDGNARIGRMAVLASVRGAGVGASLLAALVGECRSRGAGEVMLHAQVDAIEFYRRHGFQARGPRFQEAGIEHQEMVLLP
jgi:predicted GNAT family N-acyltransferase